jgi:DNA-binding NarL/FixJ family response regulator
MARTCCLAGIDDARLPVLSAAITSADAAALVTVAPLDVTELGRRSPDLLVCDVDGIDIDPIELLRQVRFVLPDATIAVYTGLLETPWGRACHLAGANCLLSKGSDQALLMRGLLVALKSGCYTDPRFAAVSAGR